MLFCTLCTSTQQFVCCDTIHAQPPLFYKTQFNNSMLLNTHIQCMNNDSGWFYNGVRTMHASWSMWLQMHTTYVAHTSHTTITTPLINTITHTHMHHPMWHVMHDPPSTYDNHAWWCTPVLYTRCNDVLYMFDFPHIMCGTSQCNTTGSRMCVGGRTHVCVCCQPILCYYILLKHDISDYHHNAINLMKSRSAMHITTPACWLMTVWL